MNVDPTSRGDVSVLHALADLADDDSHQVGVLVPSTAHDRAPVKSFGSYGCLWNWAATLAKAQAFNAHCKLVIALGSSTEGFVGVVTKT